MKILLNQSYIKNGELAGELSISLSTWVHEKTGIVFAEKGRLEDNNYEVLPVDYNFTISLYGHNSGSVALSQAPKRRMSMSVQFIRPALRTLNCCLRL